MLYVGSADDAYGGWTSTMAPYWKVLEICFTRVWLEKALNHKMNVFISANELVKTANGSVENFD